MEVYKPKYYSFEGFETWLNALKLKFKMHTRIFLILALVVLVLFSISFSYTYTYNTDVGLRWAAAKSLHKWWPKFKLRFKNSNGSKVMSTAGVIAKTPWVEGVARKELSRIGWNLLKTAIAVFVFYPFIVGVFKRRSEHQSKKRYIRGAKLDTRPQFEKIAKKKKDPLDLPFGSVKMPIKAEPKHCFVVGRPGTGKTVCLSGIMKRLKQRGAHGIVYDNKGDYLAKFYDPEQDLIFNPLDRRSLGWNLFNEIETFMDVDAMAASLIPPSIVHKDPFWSDAARAVFSGILHNLYKENARSNADIWQMITSEGSNIATALKLTRGGEAGNRFIENPESNQALGVFAVLMQHSKCFEYMAGCDGDFSVRQWLENGRGMIYVTNYADIRDTLKPILTLFIDLLGRKLLPLADSHTRRVFFMLDEVNTLQKMSTLLDLLTLSRSKGGCVFLGTQDYGQIDKLYSRELRQSIVNACGSSVIFAVADEAAKTASRNIGDTEHIDAERSYSMGVKNFKDGTNLSERKKKEALIMSSDLTNLPELTGIVRFPNYNYILSRWYSEKDPTRPKEIYPDLNEPFVLRDDLLMENIVREQEEIRQRLEEDLDIQIEEEFDSPIEE